MTRTNWKRLLEEGLQMVDPRDAAPQRDATPEPDPDSWTPAEEAGADIADRLSAPLRQWAKELGLSPEARLLLDVSQVEVVAELGRELSGLRSEVSSLTQQLQEAAEDVKALLFEANDYDDKPHRFWLRAAEKAEKYPDDALYEVATFMDRYEHGDPKRRELESALAESRRDAERLREALREVEWAGYDETGSTPEDFALCPHPRCSGSKAHGHDADCPIGAALASPPPPKEGEHGKT